MVLSNTSPNMILFDRILGHAFIAALFILIGFQLPLASSLGVAIVYCSAFMLFETVAVPLHPMDTKLVRLLAVCAAIIGAVIALSAPGVF